MKSLIGEFIANYCPGKETKMEELCSIEKHIFMNKAKVSIYNKSETDFPPLSLYI